MKTKSSQSAYLDFNKAFEFLYLVFETLTDENNNRQVFAEISISALDYLHTLNHELTSIDDGSFPLDENCSYGVFEYDERELYNHPMFVLVRDTIDSSVSMPITNNVDMYSYWEEYNHSRIIENRSFSDWKDLCFYFKEKIEYGKTHELTETMNRLN